MMKIKTERAFKRAMRRMICCVANGKRPLPEKPTHTDLEVLAECVKRGYMSVCTVNEKGEIPRNMLGVPMVDYLSEPSVLLPGLTFLHPDRAEVRANIAIIVSTISLLSTLLPPLLRWLSTLKG